MKEILLLMVAVVIGYALAFGTTIDGYKYQLQFNEQDGVKFVVRQVN